MALPTDRMRVTLLYLLHRGLVEIRNLCLSHNTKQAADLADALELIPGMLNNWREGCPDEIADIFARYQNKYPESGFNFVERFRSQSILPF